MQPVITESGGKLAETVAWSVSKTLIRVKCDQVSACQMPSLTLMLFVSQRRSGTRWKKWWTGSRKLCPASHSSSMKKSSPSSMKSQASQNTSGQCVCVIECCDL